MCGAPALAYAVTALRDAPTRAPVVAAASLLVVPLSSLASRSLVPTVGFFACAALAFIVSAASHSSPAVLVWTSIVPLAAFSTLPTRGVVAASAAAAAAVFAADHEQLSHVHAVHGVLADAAPSPAVIIAVWVLFLGLVGVVQTHINAIVVLEESRLEVWGAGNGDVREGQRYGEDTIDGNGALSTLAGGLAQNDGDAGVRSSPGDNGIEYDVRVDEGDEGDLLRDSDNEEVHGEDGANNFEEVDEDSDDGDGEEYSGEEDEGHVEEEEDGEEAGDDQHVTGMPTGLRQRRSAWW
jgi:hypothetical protein